MILQILVVKWHDNRVVTAASNYENVTPVDKARRWSAKDKKYIDVKRPAPFSNYNKNMGSVDLVDRLVRKHSQPTVRVYSYSINL